MPGGRKGHRYSLKEGVVAFLHNEIKVKAYIIEAAEIKTKRDQRIILLKLENGDVKNEVMKAKSPLKDTCKYMEDHMTKEERKIQARLRQTTKNERKLGKVVKVGYQKLTIKGKIWLWDGKTGKLVPNEPNQ